MPDYYSVITNPLCLEEMLVHVDKGGYHNLNSFLQDIEQIVRNADEYNSLTDPMRIVSKVQRNTFFKLNIEKCLLITILYLGQGIMGLCVRVGASGAQTPKEAGVGMRGGGEAVVPRGEDEVRPSGILQEPARLREGEG